MNNAAMAEAIPEPEPISSVISRNRIVAFVNDDISASALRVGFEGISQDFLLKRGDIRDAARYLENDTDLHSVIADICSIVDPLAALEDLARVCPSDVQVALIGEHNDLAFYRTVTG